jgi:uncharacterized membrane protein YhhN
MNFLRYIMSLSLVAWVGGILFFVSITPILFAVLPSRHMAGSVVSPALTRLHWIGIISGTLFLLSSLLYSRFTVGDLRPWSPANVLVALMLLLTCTSQFGLTPRLAAIRAEVPEINSAPPEIRATFDALHQWSTRLEGGVFLLGLIAVYFVSKERLP